MGKKLPDGMDTRLTAGDAGGLKPLGSAYIPFATAINDMGEGIINLRDKFDEKLVIRGVESSAKPSK